MDRKNYIPTEQPDKRNEYTKTYAVGPARHRAFSSSVPLHVRSQESWEEIDARFVPDKEYGDASLVSRGGHLTAVCSPSGEAAFITVKDSKEHSLSWGIAEAKIVVPEAVEEKIPETEDPAEGMFLEAMFKAQGHVRYPEIHPGVTMTCHMDGRFKDCFVYQDQTAVKPVTFIIKTSLHPEFNEDGSVTLVNEAGETVFTLMPPTLYDSAGNAGEANVSLKASETGFTLTYTPDPAFMGSAVYPVTLDPTVQTTASNNNITDTYVVQGQTLPTDHSSESSLWVTKSSGYGTRISYLKVDSLPTLGSDHFITEATLRLRSVNAGQTQEVVLQSKEPLADWTVSTVITSPPALSGECQDGWIISPSALDGWCEQDVTALARKWYLGQNYGAAFVPRDTGETIIRLVSANGTSGSKPYFSVTYKSLAGLEDYLSYDSQTVGRAGTGYVSLHNGNLVFCHSDTQMNGLRMPVSVTHVYNSCDADSDEFSMGKGWRTNYHRTLHKAFLDSKVWYVYGDEDGTEHWFAPPSSGTEYKDEDGLGLTLAAGDTVTVTDKMNTVITFPPVTGTPTASSPVTGKVLMTSIKDACGNQADVEVTSGTLRIAKITDGVHGANALGRETAFTYSGSPLRCARIQTPWQESTACTRFTYTSGKLTGVTYEDHTADVPKQSAYTYTDQGGYALLTGATGPEGLTAAYTYTTAGAVHAVTRATVTGGTLKGSDTDYIYGHLLTRACDRLSGKTIRYHFNDAGNLISIDDEAGYARYTRYDDSANKNHVTDTSRLQRVVVNLLTDGLLNDNSALWVQGGTGTFTRDSSVRMWGSVSQKITVTAGQTAYKRQQVTLTPGEKYTFSAWIRSGAPKAFLRVSYTQSGSTVNVDSDPVITGSSAFERIAVTFTLPTGVSSAYCSMMCTTTAGSAWFDGLQLEKGGTLNHFNLLQNSDFSKGTGTLPDKWSKLYAGSDYDFAETCSLSQSGYTPPGILDGRAIKVTGLFYASTGAYQTFNLSGSAGDRFSAGGWYAGYARKNRANNEARCRIAVQFYSAASGWVTGGAIDWNSTEGQWQFASREIAAPCDYTQVKYIIEYFRQINYAYFTGLYLYPEAFGVKYTYNASGDPVSVRTLFDKTADTQYDAYHNVTSYTAPGDTVSTTYTYGTSAAQKKKHLPIKVTSPLGTVTKNSYNGHGGIIQTDVKAEDTDTALFIRTQTDYTSGNYVSKRRDAREKEVTIVTDPNKGTVTSVTAPLHSTVTHEYDQMRRVLKSEASDGTNAHKTEYVYNAKDQLTQVKHNTTSDTSDVKYNFTYDALGRRLQVKVGTQMLSKNTYTNSGVHTGTLSKVEYGNGDSVSYVYDEFNRIRGVKYGTETTPRYEYDYNAKGQSAWVKDNQLSRVTQSEYDLADRPCRVTLRQNGSHMVTSEAAYDPVKGLLTKFTERIGTNYSGYQTTYGYDSERRPTTISYGSTSDQTKYTYDALGRITKRIVKVGGYSYESTMSYLAGGYGDNSTTGLVSQISQTGRTHVYTYNDAGSIATDRYGGKTTRYTYDGIGQLIRVDDPHDTTATDGTTWAYEYDRGGNLTKKKIYPHTTTALPDTPQSTINLTYGASAWRDKMTAYGGTAITYDAMGNPLSDGTWTYTWTNGRQLQGMTKTGTSASFLYNEEGLRVRKTVGSAVTHYFWHGDKVTYMVRGSEVLYFWYDGQNRPAVVAYNGTKYAYIYSLQGDVLALINSSGTEVVGYNYNAWGETLSVTGTLASTLGNIQPFRYRGYIYDYETGLYYLRSRYYNPVWCRFINADSLVKGNLYCYCENNPAIYLDSNGRETIRYELTDRDSILSFLWNYDRLSDNNMNLRLENINFDQYYKNKNLDKIICKYSEVVIKSSDEKMQDFVQAVSDTSDTISTIGGFVVFPIGIFLGLPYSPEQYADVINCGLNISTTGIDHLYKYVLNTEQPAHIHRTYTYVFVENTYIQEHCQIVTVTECNLGKHNSITHARDAGWRVELY